MSNNPWIPGATLANRYQILQPLGHGGMGTLYLARDLRFARRFVALKENQDRSPAAQAQFRLEAEVLATLHHPHLPAVTDHFITPDGRQFMVMDYVEGEDLEERVMRQGPLSEKQVLTWAGQILDALAYLHAQSPPVIHRDVKPANIRITPEGRAVLVDFGITKHLLPGRPTVTVARGAGSPGYAPIEQYAGGTDQRSDLYSLGATLYFALTGHVPPEAPLLAAGQVLPRPRQFNPAISPRTEAVILRAMQTDVGRRFQSAAEMQAALRGEEDRALVSNAIARMARWQKVALAVGGSLALIALCLGAVLGWVMYENTQDDRQTPVSVPAPIVTTIPAPAVVITPVTGPPIAPTSTLMPTRTPMPSPTRRPASTVAPIAPTSTLAPTRTPTPSPIPRRPATATPAPPTAPPPVPMTPKFDT